MWTRIKHILFLNPGMKVAALLSAIVLWVVVVNVEDPSKTSSFTTTVSVENENVLTEQGKYYTILDNATVTFRVTGKRSIIDRLTNGDFQAVADMTYLQDDSRIPIDITAKQYANVISISSQRHYLQIEIGNEMENRFVISASTSGKPAEGSTVKSVTVTPNIITVVGPDAIVEKIDRVTASIDVAGMSADLSETVVPQFLDKNGESVDITELSVSSETVEISVDMGIVKKVPIVVETSGELSEDYELDSIKTDPEEITIVGEASQVNDITEIKIPGTVINLDQVTNDLNTTVDISAYLPGGVSLLDSSASQVKISLKLKEDMSRTFDVPAENISVEHLRDGLVYSLDADKVTVEITGERNKVSSLTGDSLTGVVDASELLAGSHTLEVNFHLLEGLTASTATVRMTIREEEPVVVPEEEPPENTGE